MKEIKAIIQPNRLARLREQFRRIPDFPGMTVMHAEGSGYHPGKPHEAGIKGELAWIAKVVEAGVPYLGLCLGTSCYPRGRRFGGASF